MSSHGSLNRSAAYASIFVALLLAGTKLWAVLITDSTAMLGSLADTSLDLVASLATLTGVVIAAQPADEDHRFGHGKAEALAALVDDARLHAYLQLPRSASFLSRGWLESQKDVPRVELTADFRSLTGLPPAGDEEHYVPPVPPPLRPATGSRP